MIAAIQYAFGCLAFAGILISCICIGIVWADYIINVRGKK